MMYQRIVVPLDGSKLAEGVLEHVRALAHCMGSEVVLMRVIAYPAYDFLLTDPGMSASLREQLEQEACNYLEPLASADAVVVTGPIADAIIEFAREKKADLIAMSTHGRTGPSRWLLGSVADRVVRGAGMPVLMVRPLKRGKKQTCPGA
jgi:nucleotide-binding universal stress UspA family protein